jgi:hypothetical protein
MRLLFKLQNHCSTRAVQLLVQVFHLVFRVPLGTWSALCTPCGVSHYNTPSAVSALCTCCLLYSMYCYGSWCKA